MYKIAKEFNICASHRLNNPELTKKNNKLIFGKCNNEPSHGHNYKVVVKLQSTELVNGMIMNFYELKSIFNGCIDEKFDHKFLNDCKEFKNVIPTAENMAQIFYNILKKHIPQLYEIEIWETNTAYAVYGESK